MRRARAVALNGGGGQAVALDDTCATAWRNAAVLYAARGRVTLAAAAVGTSAARATRVS